MIWSYWLLHIRNLGSKSITEHYQHCCTVAKCWGFFNLWSKRLSPLTFSIDILTASCHLGGLCYFDERAFYESHISTREQGMLPSFFFSTQMQDFTSSNWLIIYSLTAGALSLCNVFCKLRSCIFFSWIYSNMSAFGCWDPTLSFPETEPALLQGFYDVSKRSVLGWRAAISD